VQAKDIPVTPVLEFLKELAGAESAQYAPVGTLSVGAEGEMPPNSVLRAMPAGVPFKVAVAKMASLVRRGLVDGCTCGCRGDFELTENGQVHLAALNTPSTGISEEHS
jgi:hypothetical protein